MLNECLLERMQRAVGGQPFNRGHRAAFILDRQREAGENPFSIHQHRAGPARALIAALLCASQTRVIPQEVEQGARVSPGTSMDCPFTLIDIR